MSNVIPFPVPPSYTTLEDGECELLTTSETGGWLCSGCGLFKPKVRGPWAGDKFCDECRKPKR